MSKLNKNQFRFLNDSELETLSEAEGRTLNADRFAADQIRMAKQFVSLASQTSDKNQKRNHSDKEQLDNCIKSAEGDIIAGLDLFLFQRADYRAEINSLTENKRAHIDYSTLAANAGPEEFKRYSEAQSRFTRGTITTADAPGIANTIDTTVAQSILFRAENNGQILPLIDKVNIPYGDYSEPYYNKYSLGGYLTETGTIADIQTDLNDATNGIKKNTWTPRDFAIGLDQSLRSIAKLSPSVLAQILDFVANGMTAGMEYQAVSGPGTGTTESGMATVATSITFNTNGYITFIDACSNVGSKNAVNKVGVMNERAWGEFKKLRVINPAYRDVINTKEKMIDDIRIIVVPETTLPTAANIATVIVGDLKHYLSVTIGAVQELSLTDPKALKKFTAFHVERDAKARFADSFAKFTLNV